MDFRGAGDPLIFFGPLRGAANSSHEVLNQTFALGGEFRGGPQACGSVWYATLSPWRPGTSGPGRQGRSGRAAGNPRPPVAIPGELEGIPEEVFGWNGSELNSGGISVSFSRNRRWNSGGWHRPGEADSGGFSRCRGPPDFFRAAARGSEFASHEVPNQTFALGEEFRGGPQACGSVWYATPSPWRQGSSGPWAAGKLWHPLVICRMCGRLFLGGVLELPQGFRATLPPTHLL